MNPSLEIGFGRLSLLRHRQKATTTEKAPSVGIPKVEALVRQLSDLELADVKPSHPTESRPTRAAQYDCSDPAAFLEKIDATDAHKAALKGAVLRFKVSEVTKSVLPQRLCVLTAEWTPPQVEPGQVPNADASILFQFYAVQPAGNSLEDARLIVIDGLDSQRRIEAGSTEHYDIAAMSEFFMPA